MKIPFAILGLPINAADERGHRVDLLLASVHTLMFALFIGWICYFVYALFRYHQSRNPKANYKGMAGHASTYVEGLVALIEISLLVGLALPIWSKTVVDFPSEKDSTVIRVVAQQFQWNGWYPSTSGAFSKADAKFVGPGNTMGFDKSDPNSKSNFVVMTDLEVPVNKPVIAYISSLDVIHSFACRPMRAMQDAIPGMVIPVHFTPKMTGSYMINCAQLCGSGHSRMRGNLKVVSQEDYDKWVTAKMKAANP